MKCVFLCCVFLLLGATKCIGASLTWSDSYSYEAILTTPNSDILEPYKVWVDGLTGNTRVDFYNGLVKLYRLRLYGIGQSFAYFKIYPETTSTNVNQIVCRRLKNYDFAVYTTNTYLPIRNFTYHGLEKINGHDSQKWKALSFTLVEGFKVFITYIVWATYDNNNVTIPLRYEYKVNVGNLTIDHYYHEYTKFNAAGFDKSVFDLADEIPCSEMNLPEFEPYEPLLEYIEPMVEQARIKNDIKKFINSQNIKPRSYSVAANHLADAIDDELLMHLDDDDEGMTSDDLDDEAVENENETDFDWRNYGAVSPVKDQTTMCGASYAFTTAAVVESSLFIQRGLVEKMEAVSEQAIIDCSWRANKYGNFGCRGGNLKASLRWVMERGIPYSADYGRYLAMEGLCHAYQETGVARIRGFVKVNKDIETIKHYLRKQGPLAVTVDWTPKSIQFYSNGVYNDTRCTSSKLTPQSQCMALIGYGKENGQEFWTLKNSRGPNWGEEGYIRIAIKNNTCGVMNNVFSILTANSN